MTRARVARWTLLFMVGLSVGAMLAQSNATPTPESFRVPAPGESVLAYPVRVVNTPPVPQDPWFVRYAALLVLVGGGFLSIYLKAKVIDPIRTEVREEAAARNLALVTMSATFERSLAGINGTVAGLNSGVAALGPAISSISGAATEMAKTAAKIATDQAVAQAELNACKERIAKLENTSHGYQESRR